MIFLKISASSMCVRNNKVVRLREFACETSDFSTNERETCLIVKVSHKQRCRYNTEKEPLLSSFFFTARTFYTLSNVTTEYYFTFALFLSFFFIFFIFFFFASFFTRTTNKLSVLVT